MAWCVLQVAKSYGAKRIYDIPAMARDDPHRYPFVSYGAYVRVLLNWAILMFRRRICAEHKPLPAVDRDAPFAAVFILHDPNDWGVEIQIAIDAIRGGHPLGSGAGQSIPVFASNPDLVFAGAHPVPRYVLLAITGLTTWVVTHSNCCHLVAGWPAALSSRPCSTSSRKSPASHLTSPCAANPRP
jgi:hypothetical protein